MKNFLKKYMTLKFRIPAIIMLSIMVIGTSIIGISFKRYEALNVEKHVKTAEGITNLMVDGFDADKYAYFIEHNYSSDEYKALLKNYYTIKDSYLDVEHMYISHIFKDENDGAVKGITIVYLDEEYTENVPQSSIARIGNMYKLDATTAKNIDKIISGKECFWEIVKSEETGTKLLSYIRPILDSDGNYLCSACVDFSLNAMYGKGLMFIVELLAVIVVEFFAVIVIVNILLSAILFKPLKKMTGCIKSFKYDTNADRYDNLNNMEALNIHLNNEIDELYDALVLSLKDSAFYMQNYDKAKGEIEEISETAYKDALTGVGSKTAYNNAVTQLQTDLEQQKVSEFGIVMVDINNLKYVNDTFGHERGDEYIKECCSIVCNIFKKSPVFRIGGDEFVVLLKDDDLHSGTYLTGNMQNAFERAYKNSRVEEYRRYSASFGMAIFDPENDKCVEDVFKRADSLMYEYKREFKAANGSYR